MKKLTLKELNELKYSEDQIKRVLPFKIFHGNKPSTSILIKKLTPNIHIVSEETVDMTKKNTLSTIRKFA